MRIGLSDLLEADLTEVLRRMLEAALAGVGIGWSFWSRIMGWPGAIRRQRIPSASVVMPGFVFVVGMAGVGWVLGVATGLVDQLVRAHA